MPQYAASTDVPADRSRAEIERTLQRYGADSFMYGWNVDDAVIAFRCNGRHVKFVVKMPDRDDPKFTMHSRGRRSEDTAMRAWEQATRQRWRALALVIKAKLEAVESGISTFEAEFLANTMLPDGQTVGDWIEPQMQKAYADGVMPGEIKLALPRGK